MKRSALTFFGIVPAGILAFALAAPAKAQLTPHAAAKVDNYLVRHPGVAHQLQANPGLIDNKKFVANHPGLHEFLQNHPGVREQWKAAAANNGAYPGIRAHRYQRAKRRYEHREGAHS